MAIRHVFHGFLQQSRFTLWIWLESEYIPEQAGAFHTRLSDRRTACSHPVGAPTLLSIAVSILSAASTGIGYYYCIYINISLYIFRRSNRQAVLLEFLKRKVTDYVLVLWRVLKSGPFMVRTRHISCRRERMRSVMRSPSVSSREAERASSSSRDFRRRETSFSALPEGPSGKLVVMIVVFCSL